jgi:hypothetical protein
VRFPDESGKLISGPYLEKSDMRRRLLVGCTAVAVGVLMLFAPVVPSNALSYAGPSMVPPVNHWVLRDPTGTYTGSYLGNGTYSMNLTAYEKLLHDPYTGTPQSNVKVEGTTVYIYVPPSNTVSGPTHGTIDPPVPASNDLESVTWLLLGHGAMLADGNYYLR